MAAAAPNELGLDPREFSSWAVSGQAPVIEYSRRILDEIRAETVDGLHRLRHGGIEVGGVLFGVRNGDRIRVLNRRSLQCEYAQGPTFLLSEKDEASLETLIAGAKADPQLSGLEPVGWYHSHTRSGVFLSDADMAIYARHFPKLWQIALVLRPTQLGPAEAGFFFREPDGKVRVDSSYSPFTAYPLAKGRLPRPGPQGSPRPEVRVRSGAKNPDSAPEPALPKPQRPPEPIPPKQRWPWLVVAGVLVALGIGALAGVLPISGPSRPAIGLRAADQDGQIRIEWDRFAEPIRSAQKASLLLVDGARRVEKTLSPDLLQHGNVVYYRKSEDVEIRLQIPGAGSEPVQAMTRLIGLPGPKGIPSDRQEAADRTRPVSAGTAAEGPKTGRVVWTGKLAAKSTLTIDGNQASTGSLMGKLPKDAVKIRVYPANFSGAGVTAFARELPGNKDIGEKQDPGTGWTRPVVYRRNPKRAGDVVVTEIPSAQNNWKTIGLRAERPVTAIVLDWEALPLEPQP
jgi:proteasome lid subunit RPN8/RPN11